jgi:hypothetical protein
MKKDHRKQNVIIIALAATLVIAACVFAFTQQDPTR